MRITFITPPPDRSGGTRVIAGHADRLQRRGHEVTVVYAPPAEPSLRQRLATFLGGRKPATRESAAIFGMSVEQRELDRHRPVTADDVPDGDVVIATWWETAEWVAEFPESKGAKAILIQGYELFPWIPVDRLDATWRLPFHKIVVSQWLAGIARDKFGDGDVSVVPNGVDMDAFNADPRTKQPSPTVGFMYSDMRGKGIDIALAGIALARKDIPDLRVVSVGHGQPTSALPLPKDVVFHSNADTGLLCEVYASCDVWLFTSRAEGFGLPILEAMACRTPVIATPAGAAPELLERGGGGLLDSHEPDAVADAILRVVRMDDPQWRGLSDAAYATAQENTCDASTHLFELAVKRAVDRSANTGSAC